MKNALRNQTVIITGASSGIGKEAALQFAAAGANVVLAARRLEALEKIRSDHPGFNQQMLCVATDVTKDGDVERLVAAALSRFDRIDVLVNNAGAGLRALVTELKTEDVERLMELNLFGVLRCTKAVLPHLKRQGRGQIVNIGSVLSAVATPRNGAYCASKFALRALTDVMRMELRSAGIEVIFIMPGYTDTPFFDNMVRYDGSPHLSPFRGQHPRKVARAIVNACRRHKREVVLTVPGRIGVWVKRLAPRLVDFSLGRSV